MWVFDIVISFLAADTIVIYKHHASNVQHQHQGSLDLKTAHSRNLGIDGVGQFIYCYTGGNTNY